MGGLADDNGGHHQLGDVGGNKRPFGHGPKRGIFHGGSVRKRPVQRKCTVLSPRLSGGKQNHVRVRICVIFNPAARGNKARHFRRHCVEHARQCEFKATSASGEARHLACEAVINGFETIVAAGGDGTVNEVLNG
ncbi:MAG: acylglycerol kinase family protein, partial [Verrucomicrobiota bacterium]